MKRVIKAARTSELLKEFMKYHDDRDNYIKNKAGFDEMYEILNKYDDSNGDDDVSVAFLKATPEDQQAMVDLINPFRVGSRPGTKEYCREMYYSALAGEWSESYKVDRAIVETIEALFQAGWLDEEEFRTDL